MSTIPTYLKATPQPRSAREARALIVEHGGMYKVGIGFDCASTKRLMSLRVKILALVGKHLTVRHVPQESIHVTSGRPASGQTF
jgi:hypothetical protein